MIKSTFSRLFQIIINNFFVHDQEAFDYFTRFGKQNNEKKIRDVKSICKNLFKYDKKISRLISNIYPV